MKTMWTIVQHEFLSRVRTKAFIISTLLAPFAVVLVFALPVAVMKLAGTAEHHIAVLDYSSSGIGSQIVAEDSLLFFEAVVPEDSLRSRVLRKELSGYLLIPQHALEKDSVVLATGGSGGISLQTQVETAVKSVFQRQRLLRAGADPSLLSLVTKGVTIERLKITAMQVERDRFGAAIVIGYILSIVVYVLLFTYGGIVMRSVLDEKTNRIVELLASSARPFDIMVGKVIGVGAVGLFQVMIWVVLVSGILLAAGSMLISISGASTIAQAEAFYRAQDRDFAAAMLSLPSFSEGHIAAFIFFFLAGYVFYSSLFAGIAAAADQEQDAQLLQLPVSMFIVIPMLTITAVMDDPTSTLSVVLSLIPMFSPMVMLMRVLISEVQWWQIALSVVLLCASIVGALWLAGRIYRIGILRYGQRPSFRQILRWAIEG